MEIPLKYSVTTTDKSLNISLSVTESITILGWTILLTAIQKDFINKFFDKVKEGPLEESIKKHLAGDIMNFFDAKGGFDDLFFQALARSHEVSSILAPYLDVLREDIGVDEISPKKEFLN